MNFGCIRLFLPTVLVASAVSTLAQPSVVINEIMYHPVEEPAFNTNGTPVMDLYEDVHEFIELRNFGTSTVPLDGWKLTAGIDYSFPTGAVLRGGEYLVVAKNPARLKAVTAYGLKGTNSYRETNLFGPYEGQLSNRGETVRLKDDHGNTIDSVSYASEFPWAISANALGANRDWTGLDPLKYQYRGRSLERVSPVHPGNDPANWVASPLVGPTANPSPGKRNSVNLVTPKPVVVNLRVSQSADGQAMIRNNQPVRIDCQFSATNGLSGVKLEFFYDNIEVTNEVRSITNMVMVGKPRDGKFTAVLPGKSDRTIVRYRIRANRGFGDEAVSPRADDPFAWYGYFVSPPRSSANPVYDVFISAANLNTMNSNISQSPKRVDGSGVPRKSWNATVPAVFVHQGVVYDAQIRYHGSRYNRSAGRQSYKVQFPRYQPFKDHTSMFITDKQIDTVAGHAIFREAGLPTSMTQWVDFYLNGNALLVRLEQEEYDDAMLERYARDMAARNPGTPIEPPGELYKSVGTLDIVGEGPYGRGDERLLAPRAPWSSLTRYEWTYSLQDNDWRGQSYFKSMLDGMWQARGDTADPNNINPPSASPNVSALRAYLAAQWDMWDPLESTCRHASLSIL